MSLTVVSGFQRCGSSLMMQMLSAGGLPVFHDPEMGYPAFETMRQFDQADDPSWCWLLPLDGFAVKWLEPQRAMPPALPFELRTIWMRRNPAEQAKSAVKFLTSVGGLRLPSTFAARKAFRGSYLRDTPKAIAAWKARGPVLVLAFEDVVYHPEDSARRVTDFLGVSLDVAAMARAVIGRDDRCLPGFLELELIARRPA